MKNICLAVLLFVASSSIVLAAHESGGSSGGSGSGTQEENLDDHWLYCKYIDGNQFNKDSVAYFSKVFNGEFLKFHSYQKWFADYLSLDLGVDVKSYRVRCSNWTYTKAYSVAGKTQREFRQELRAAIRKAKGRYKEVHRTNWTPDS